MPSTRLSGVGDVRTRGHHSGPRALVLEIHSALFETGLDFLTKPYKVQWAEAERRLQTIASSARS